MTDEAGIIIDKRTVGIWFFTPDQKVDWLAMLREIEPDLQYELIYRFRYHMDDKAFDSADEKSWYQVIISGTRSFAIAGIRSTVKMMEEHSPNRPPVYELLSDGDVKAFMGKLFDAPFAFARMER